MIHFMRIFNKIFTQILPLLIYGYAGCLRILPISAKEETFSYFSVMRSFLAILIVPYDSLRLFCLNDISISHFIWQI